MPAEITETVSTNSRVLDRAHSLLVGRVQAALRVSIY